MGLNIKNERTHALVRELATMTGVSQTEAVEEAVRARLAELGAERDSQRRFERTMAISRELTERLGAPLSTDDLYDDLGVPK